MKVVSRDLCTIITWQRLFVVAELAFILWATTKSIQGYVKYNNRGSYNVQGRINSLDWFIVKDGYSSDNCSKNEDPIGFSQTMSPIANFDNSSINGLYGYYIKRSPVNALIHIGFWSTLSIVIVFSFKEIYEKLKEPKESNLECCCPCCCCCCQDLCCETDRKCSEKAKLYRLKCWKGYKSWLYEMLLTVPDSFISGFNYDSICLEANTNINKLIATFMSTLTFYLPFIILLLIVDDKLPSLLKRLQKCFCDTQNNLQSNINLKKKNSCINYLTIIIWLLVTIFFVIFLTVIAITCFLIAFYDDDTKFIAVYVPAQIIIRLIYRILGLIRRCRRIHQSEYRKTEWKSSTAVA